MICQTAIFHCSTRGLAFTEMVCTLSITHYEEEGCILLIFHLIKRGKITGVSSKYSENHFYLANIPYLYLPCLQSI